MNQVTEADTIEKLQCELTATEKCRVAAESHALELGKTCASLENKIREMNKELEKQVKANDVLREAYKLEQDNAASNTRKAMVALETLEGICGYLRSVIGKEGAK